MDKSSSTVVKNKDEMMIAFNSERKNEKLDIIPIYFYSAPSGSKTNTTGGFCVEAIDTHFDEIVFLQCGKRSIGVVLNVIHYLYLQKHGKDVDIHYNEERQCIKLKNGKIISGFVSPEYEKELEEARGICSMQDSNRKYIFIINGNSPQESRRLTINRIVIPLLKILNGEKRGEQRNSYCIETFTNYV